MDRTDPQFACWHPAQGLSRLRDTFEQRGLVLLQGIASPAEFIGQLGQMGSVYHRQDEDRPGLSHIRPDRSIMARYHFDPEQTALEPHTDRCALAHPPRMLAIWVERQSRIGGTSLFVDGEALYADVAVHCPDIMSTLCRPGAIVYKSDDGDFVESSIFSLAGGRFSIRFKLDKMVYLAPDLAAVLPRFQETIRTSALNLRIASHEGYLIDNLRWLHGRTAFMGERSAWRLLIEELAG
ncbi:TauD/TfdA family dioxygenase [Paludibacterium yongneupense]|uniref:TauD/TfdA family dioxygenase n=1 Tax=Paludibacterium yongneupense TaxID=400061 RepID=UPI0004900193|nr:TauD/TfdA family dioxygenase [Paludibacterium yongneupense]